MSRSNSKKEVTAHHPTDSGYFFVITWGAARLPVAPSYVQYRSKRPDCQVFTAKRGRGDAPQNPTNLPNRAAPGSLRGRGPSVEEGFKREPLGVPFAVSFFCEAFSFFCSKERKCVEPTGKFCRKISGACRHGKNENAAP